MNVIATAVRLEGTLGHGWGFEEDAPDRAVYFVGDRRMMAAVAEAIGTDGTIKVALEPHQVVATWTRHDDEARLRGLEVITS